MSEMENELLTTAEAAKVVKLHPKTLRLLARDGHVTAVRFGRRKLLFERSSLIAALRDAHPQSVPKAA